MRGIILKALIVGGVVSLASAAAAQGPTLKFASFPPPPGALNKSVLGPWVQSVNAKLGGKATFKLFMGGALGRNPVQQYKLVKDRVADLAYVVMAYTPGDFPDTSVFELPFLVESALEGSLAHWRAHERGLLRGYDQVKVLGLFTIPAQSIHTKKAIQSIDDIRGLKIRAAGPYQSASLKILGATPVGRIPIPKVAQSLSSGIVDGTLSDWNGMIAFRLVNLAKNHFEIPLGAAAGGILMNKEVFDELPAEARSIIDANSGEALSRLNGVEFDKRYDSNLARTRGDGSHNFIFPPADQREALRKRLHPVTEQWIERNPEGRKRYDAISQLVGEIRKK